MSERRRATQSRGRPSAGESSSFVTISTVIPYRSRRRSSSVEDLRAGLRVERAGRLVGEEQPRLVRERAGDRDPLALAAGERARPRLRSRRRARPRRAARAARSSRSRRRTCARSSAPARSRARSASASGCGTGRRSRRSRPGTRTDRRARSSSSPPTTIDPESGRSSAPIRFSSVLLPQPDGAGERARTRPPRSGSETSSSARIRPVLERLATWSTTTSAPRRAQRRRDDVDRAPLALGGHHGDAERQRHPDRDSGGHSTASRKTPLNGMLVTYFVCWRSTATGGRAPIGSTTATVIRAASGLPFGVDDLHRVRPARVDRGLCVPAVSVALKARR